MATDLRSDCDKFMFRLPGNMRHAIKETAVRNRRSMNAEILVHLEGIFGSEQCCNLPRLTTAAEGRKDR